MAARYRLQNRNRNALAPLAGNGLALLASLFFQS